MKKLFRMIQFLTYLSFGLYFANLIPFMTTNGYTLIERGAALSGLAVANIIFQLVFGYISDKTQSLKWLIMISTTLYAIISLLFFMNVIPGFVAMLFLVCISAGLLNSLCGLYDIWMIGMGKEMTDALSATKAFGSMGWGVGSLLSALLLSAVGYTGIGVVVGGMGILASVVMWFIPDIHKQVASENKEEVKYTVLLANKQYVLLLLALFLMYFLIVVNTGLVVDKMILLQASQFDISLKWAMGSFLEIPAYFLGVRLMKKYHPKRLLMFSSVVLIVQFVLFSLAPNSWMIIAVSMLQLFTTPIVLVTSKLLIIDVVPKNLQNSAQMVALSVYMGGGSLLAPIVSSALASITGINATLLILSTCAVGAFFILQKSNK